jgi:hypothetical protein
MGVVDMDKIKLADIKISKAFLNSTPKASKMKKCRENWDVLGKQDRYIIVNRNNVLIDGYVMYLVLKENGVDETEIKVSDNICKTIPAYRNEPTVYVYGHHPKDIHKKTYTWRIPKSWGDYYKNIEVNDMIFCDTKNGSSPVIVDGIELLDSCPVDMPVKRVTCKIVKKVNVEFENGRKDS